MALTIASLGTSTTWASIGTGKTLSFSSVTAGSVLVVVATAGAATETFLNPTSGWTPGPATNTGDFVCVTYWKVANGSETSFSIDASTSTGNLSGCSITGFTGTATLEGSNENEANITGSGVTSISTNAASNTTATAAAIALFGSDRWDSVETSRGYTNSFTEVVAATASGSRAGAWIAGKVLSSAGSNSTTFSCSDTGDQLYGAILVFGDVTSSGTTVSVPLGTLTLTGFAPTVTTTANQTVAVPVGALTLTGFAPTVTASDHKTVAVPAGSLTLTGFAPTVSVAPVSSDVTVNVPLGTLTLTGFAPTIAVSDNKTVSVPLGQITLTGFAPTVTATQNVTVNIPTGQLTLTGFAPTVTGSVVASKGSRTWTESEYKLNQRLRKLAKQQSYIEDDEEALAILLASIIRR